MTDQVRGTEVRVAPEDSRERRELALQENYAAPETAKRQKAEKDRIVVEARLEDIHRPEELLTSRSKMRLAWQEMSWDRH